MVASVQCFDSVTCVCVCVCVCDNIRLKTGEFPQRFAKGQLKKQELIGPAINIHSAGVICHKTHLFPPWRKCRPPAHGIVHPASLTSPPSPHLGLSLLVCIA